jgi:CheY-like chemotaxis protein
LIIDDDSFNLEVIARLLKIEGIASIQAQNLQQIHAAIDAKFKPDIVFLDLEMPEMDGYQVLRSLRCTLDTSIPVIACTVHLNEAATIREQGFDGFIAKPLDPKRFSAQIRQILNGERVWEF